MTDHEDEDDDIKAFGLALQLQRLEEEAATLAATVHCLIALGRSPMVRMQIAAARQRCKALQAEATTLQSDLEPLL